MGPGMEGSSMGAAILVELRREPAVAGGNSISAASLTRGGGVVYSACYQQKKIIYNIEYLITSYTIYNKIS